MAQFDVYRTMTGNILVDCQTDQLSHLNTRIVVPLFPIDPAFTGPRRLNPMFVIDGEPRVLMTEFVAAIPTRELRTKIASLTDDYLTVESAFDYLLSGF